jgi:hypothetical protein
MKILVLVPPAIFVGALAFIFAQPAHAATISIKGHSPSQVKSHCSGGTYFGPGGKGQPYGCLAQDGSGIVCAGTGDNYAKTCDTWGPDPSIAANTKPTQEDFDKHAGARRGESPKQ